MRQKCVVNANAFDVFAQRTFFAYLLSVCIRHGRACTILCCTSPFMAQLERTDFEQSDIHSKSLKFIGCDFKFISLTKRLLNDTKNTPNQFSCRK